jgi:hypothetical protein
MRTLNDYFITAEIEDISTTSSTFVAIPDGGKVIKIITALQGAISGANAAITFEVGGTAMTNSAITVAHTSSAAGDVDSSEPTAANTVEEDGTIENDNRWWIYWNCKTSCYFCYKKIILIRGKT